MRHRLGGRNAWIVFCTTMLVATLLISARVDFETHFSLLLAMIVLNNVFCATQDVAIDWQGVVAESMGYAGVYYRDALFALLVILVIPFLREREERSAGNAILI